MADLRSRSFRRCSSSLIRSVPDFNRLTEELIIEILKRLPLKQANRCKCVCKRWFNSMSSPYFARCYIRHRCSLTPSFALFFQYTDTCEWKVPVNLRGVQLANDVENNPVLNSPGFSLNFLSPPFSQSSEPVRFLASSNGLVLCSTSIFEQKLYYVCNPLTMHWVALPPPPTCPFRVSIGFICGTPDFHKDGIISRFKVVRIPEFGKGLHPDLRLEIFSSETGEWTDCVISCHQPVFNFNPWGDIRAVVCNGMLHWISLYVGHILAFDPYKEVNEEFQTIALPKESCNEAYVSLFGESRGRLRYAKFNQDTIRVWELNDYSSGEWSLVHKLHQSEIVWENPKLNKYTPRRPDFWVMLAFHPIDGDIIFRRVRGHIIECNLRRRSFKSLCSLAHRSVCPHQTIFPYVLPWWPISAPQC